MWGSLLLVALLPTGVVVDAGGRGEVRETALAEAPAEGGFFGAQSTLSISPLVRAAWEGPQVFFDGSYAPQLSLVYPSQDLLLLLHRANVRAEYLVEPRVRLSADASGAIGDLDAGAAQRTLASSRGILVGGGGLTSFPFASITSGAQLAYRSSPRLSFDTRARVDVSGSPGAPESERFVVPLQVRPQLGGSGTWLFSQTQSLTGDVSVLGAVTADQGPWSWGLQTTTSWNESLSRGVLLSLRAGVLVDVVGADPTVQSQLLFLPVLDGRLRASLNLPDDAAIEGAVVAGLAPFSDPLGGVLEERLSLSFLGGWRANRHLSFSGQVTAFGTLLSVGVASQTALQAQTASTVAAGMSWLINDHWSWDLSALWTGRLLLDKFGRPSQVLNDVGLVAGVTMTFPVYHEGDRPNGTDPRAGRAIGTRAVSLPGSAQSFRGGSQAQAPSSERRGVGFRQSADPDAPETEDFGAPLPRVDAPAPNEDQQGQLQQGPGASRRRPESTAGKKAEQAPETKADSKKPAPKKTDKKKKTPENKQDGARRPPPAPAVP